MDKAFNAGNGYTNPAVDFLGGKELLYGRGLNANTGEFNQSLYFLIWADIGNGDEVIACNNLSMTTSTSAIRMYNRLSCRYGFPPMDGMSGNRYIDPDCPYPTPPVPPAPSV